MRLHEITNTPGDYLLTDFQIENVIAELLRTVGSIPQNLMTSQPPDPSITTRRQNRKGRASGKLARHAELVA